MATVDIDEAGMARWKDSIESACDTVIRLVRDDASERAPKRTGRLAGEIVVSGDASAGYRVTAEAPYSGYVERGTDKFAAEPFLRPAIHHEYVIE